MEAVYGPAAKTRFAPSLRDNLAVLRHLMLARTPDLWHFFFAPNPRSSVAGQVARAIRKVPSVHTVCSAPAEAVPVRHLLFADLTVALSRFTHERFVAEGVSEASIRLIPPSVPPLSEPTPSRRTALRLKHALPADAPIWIYPGDLEFGNGAEVAIRGFAAWNRREAVLLMACRRKTARADQTRRRLLALCKQWGIETRVRWLGDTPSIHELLALSDFVVMVNDTAYAKMDYPLVALEAMCMARPLLVGSGSPSAELAEDGAAVAVDADGEALAAVIENLSADRKVRAELGSRARALATSRFSPAEVAGAYERLYEELHA